MKSFAIPRKIYDSAGKVKKLVFEDSVSLSDKVFWAETVANDMASFSKIEHKLAIDILLMNEKFKVNKKQQDKTELRKKKKIERTRKKQNRKR